MISAEWNIKVHFHSRKWSDDMTAYRTAIEPEHRVAHIPPIVAPGPTQVGREMY